jgi:putative transposon-encoded protein
MSREINAIKHKNLNIKDGIVKEIFETKATKSGNGAIIYVPLKYLDNKFYVVVC